MSPGSEDYLRAAIDTSVSLAAARSTAADHEKARAQAQADADRLWIERAVAIWHLYHDVGHTAPEIARELEDGVRGRSLTDDQIRNLGISHDAVRRIVGSRRHPAKEPQP